MNVVLIMLDGLRPDAITEERTPFLSRAMARGAYTLTAQSVVPSITLPCHTSIFHSVSPEQHGVFNNVWNPVPTLGANLVGQLQAHGKRSAFFHNWDVLRDLTRPQELYFNFYMNTGYDLDGDEVIVEQAALALAHKRFDFTFVYFASIDVSGHTFGWMSEDYLRQVEIVDALAGKLLEAIPPTTTIILQADHGGHNHDHGTDLPEDMTIPWIILGPGIKRGYQIRELVTLLDTAPTIAALLDVPAPQEWVGHIVREAFANGE